ncbi:hypothetical protein E2C01_096274 [Portunus trituberculatus]|uniref:Uncharacterized protein n=1 Tax=Portunus trituberculatus TaxID=210409 RepID=A0A5B7K7T2_PORTR|nr:hypothetical protein [Portunus trituberculatus]
MVQDEAPQQSPCPLGLLRLPPPQQCLRRAKSFVLGPRGKQRALWWGAPPSPGTDAYFMSSSGLFLAGKTGLDLPQ